MTPPVQPEPPQKRRITGAMMAIGFAAGIVSVIIAIRLLRAFF